MISLFFIESVPILEPLGRQKNYRERVSDFDLGAELACRIERGNGGWLICNGLDKDGAERVSSGIKHPWSFVPDANIKFVEGSPEALRAAHGMTQPMGLVSEAARALTGPSPAAAAEMAAAVADLLPKSTRSRKPKSATKNT
jgi:hypothetical protein